MAENRGKYLKFIWKVENFSFIWNKTDDFLESETFYLDIFEGSAWCLKLYPRGRSSYENYVSVFLERLSSCEGPFEITIDFEIGLLKPNGATDYMNEMKGRCFKTGDTHGFNNLVARERMLGAKKSVLLPEDVLSLQCCIFPKDTELRTYTEVIAKTHTRIERYHHQWKGIDYTSDIENISLNWDHDGKDMWFSLMVSSEFSNSPDILRGWFFDVTDVKALHCRIGVLDSNNAVVKLLKNRFLDIDSASDGALLFPLLTVTELLEKESLYLPNGRLNLDCEFTLSYGFQCSSIEAFARDFTFTSVPVDETASTSEIGLPSKKFLYCIENMPSSLKNDLQNLYQEETLCDFTIKIGDKNLQVHKAMLCARSPVFKRMLTNNMKENQENMMDISDLDEDTVGRMLTFMYTDMAGNLDWETAYKLYFAADKYSLITLKSICSEVLKHNLSISNVGEVLVLGHMHSDEYLKKIAVEFICGHETDVMSSTEWETFMTEKEHLAAITMHQIFLKKAENRR